MTTTIDLYDANKGLFKTLLEKPQVIDMTAAGSECKLELVQDFRTIHDGTGLSGGAIKVPVWGYKSKTSKISFSSPGPIILTRQNNPVSITWKNNLPPSASSSTIFPFLFSDPLPSGEDPLPLNLRRKIDGKKLLKANIITHMHGAVVQSGSDGWPSESYGSGRRRTHHYENTQPASTIWYHDHAEDQTGLNVYAGIAGGYVILDQTDEVLAGYLASLGGNDSGWATEFGHGSAGIPLVIQDRLLDDDGKHFVYSTNYEIKPSQTGIKVGTGGEFFGRINLVNGQVSPRVEIAATGLRLKLLNGCNSRFLLLCFADDQYQPIQVPIYYIGDDHGRRDTAKRLTDDFIRLGPGERLDVIADFSQFPGQKIQLVDRSDAPFGGEAPGQLLADKRNNPLIADTKNYNNYPEILLFDISNTAQGKPVVPEVLNKILLTGNAIRTRVIALREFVMYMEHHSMCQEHPPMFVERCSPNGFNNDMAHEPLAMLVLEELEVAKPGDPVTYQSNVNLFDPNNSPGSYNYKIVGNSAGTLDSCYANPILRYVNDMDAWLNHPFNIKADSTEIWRFVNLTGDTHPMHIHLVGFHVVDSSSITTPEPPQENGLISIIEVNSSTVAPNLPDHLTGFKDTVQIDPATILTLVATFEGGKGRYVYHCHMLEHEDHMMMRKFKVI